MIVNSPAAVAAAFSRSSRPVLPGGQPLRGDARADHHRGQEPAAEELGGHPAPQRDRSAAHGTHLDGPISSVKIESMNTEVNKSWRSGPRCTRRWPTRPGCASSTPSAPATRPRRSWPPCSRYAVEPARAPPACAGTGRDHHPPPLRRRPPPYLSAADPRRAGVAGPPRQRAPRGRVLFVCTANSARSHLAAALWRRASTVPAASAGTHPAARVDPGATAAARRHRLPMPRLRPRHISDVRQDGDLVITVCDLAHEELGRPGSCIGPSRTRSRPGIPPASTRR